MWESDTESDECNCTDYTSDDGSENDEVPDLQDISDSEFDQDEVYESEEESSVLELVSEEELNDRNRLTVASISVPASYGFRDQGQLVAPPVHDGIVTVIHTEYADDEVIVYLAGIQVVSDSPQNECKIEWF